MSVPLGEVMIQYPKFKQTPFSTPVPPHSSHPRTQIKPSAAHLQLILSVFNLCVACCEDPAWCTTATHTNIYTSWALRKSACGSEIWCFVCAFSLFTPHCPLVSSPPLPYHITSTFSSFHPHSSISSTLSRQLSPMRLSHTVQIKTPPNEGWQCVQD